MESQQLLDDTRACNINIQSSLGLGTRISATRRVRMTFFVLTGRFHIRVPRVKPSNDSTTSRFEDDAACIKARQTSFPFVP